MSEELVTKIIERMNNATQASKNFTRSIIEHGLHSMQYANAKQDWADAMDSLEEALKS